MIFAPMSYIEHLFGESLSNVGDTPPERDRMMAPPLLAFPHRQNRDGSLDSIVDWDVEEQNQIADHLFGMVARRDGKPFDRSQTPAWRRGWAGASLINRRPSVRAM
jgi:hypothetical protein